MITEVHKSLSSVLLDDRLYDFTNRARDLEAHIIQELDEDSKSNMIFVTNDEREEFEKASNMTIQELESAILTMIKQFPAYKQEMLNDIFKKSIKKKTKNFYVNYHDDIKQQLSSINAE